MLNCLPAISRAKDGRRGHRGHQGHSGTAGEERVLQPAGTGVLPHLGPASAEARTQGLQSVRGILGRHVVRPPAGQVADQGGAGVPVATQADPREREAIRRRHDDGCADGGDEKDRAEISAVNLLPNAQYENLVKYVKEKISGLLRKFESIKANVWQVYGTLEELGKLRIRAQQSLDRHYLMDEIEKLEKAKVKETQMILEEYHSTSSDVYSLLNMSLSYFSPPKTTEEAKGILRRIAIECDALIGALNVLITPLSPEEVDRLNQLRSEVKKLSSKLEIGYEKNLNEAINEYEKGHYLASALITGRVIIYILDQVEGGTEEEKIKFLQDHNVIPRGRKDIKEFIMKASRKARHFFAHDIKIFATASDALSLLGDCVKLVEILAKLKNSSQKTSLQYRHMFKR